MTPLERKEGRRGTQANGATNSRRAVNRESAPGRPKTGGIMTNLSARDNVVERVARKAKQLGDAAGDPNWWNYVEQAEAALSAGSPEPTREMIEAGERAWMSRNLNDPDSNPIRDCYLAMEAARKGGE
jgi:hypothetical protein